MDIHVTVIRVVFSFFKCTGMELLANILICYFIKLSFYIYQLCFKVLGFIQSLSSQVLCLSAF